MKIAIWSNAPWMETGYGTQTCKLANGLRDDGHEVVILANAGFQGGVIRWEGFEVYGNGWAPPLGEDSLRRWIPIVRPDLIITLADLWAMDIDIWREIAELHKIKIACWAPIDRMPITPGNQRFIREVKPIVLPMSLWGEGQLRRACAQYDDVTVVGFIPHSIDTEIFRPKRPSYNGIHRDGWPAREELGIDWQRWVVGMVGMNSGVNPCRKAFPAVMLAFSRWITEFAEDDPHRPLLYLHTGLQARGGIDLMALKETVGIRDEDMRATPREMIYGGFRAERVADLYSAFDCLAAPSLGEGFGIPVIEAQACGLPVIINHFSAQPELLGAGLTVSGMPWWDGALHGWFQEPNVHEIIEGFKYLYGRKPKIIDQDSAQAVEFAGQFADERVFNHYWRPLLDSLR